jgi:hypothetical protein
VLSGNYLRCVVVVVGGVFHLERVVVVVVIVVGVFIGESVSFMLQF